MHGNGAFFSVDIDRNCLKRSAGTSTYQKALFTFWRERREKTVRRINHTALRYLRRTTLDYNVSTIRFFNQSIGKISEILS